MKLKETMDVESLIYQAAQLPRNWHGAGSLHKKVLEEIAKLPRPTFSIETGTGKSTLLFSHLSRNHIVFTQDDREHSHSLDQVRNCDLLGRNVTFIVGPTQLTLPNYEFRNEIHIALLDGPHGFPFPELEYYYIYPHIARGGFLIVDDIHIPTVTRLCEFICYDQMFKLVKVVRNTAFFQRTDAPLFDPLGDGWWLQGFNKKHYPNFRFSKLRLVRYVSHYMPTSLKARLERLFRQASFR